MQRRSMLLGLGSALIGGLWLTLPSFAPVHGNHGNHNKRRHGSPVGTYLVTFSVGTSKLFGVVTTNADGTFTGNDQTDQAGVTGFDSKQGAWHGTWKMVGKRKMQLTGMCLSFHKTTGAPTAVNRIFGVLDFAKGFKTASGLTSQRFYNPWTQDPLDQTDGAAAPPPLNALPVSLRKLRINK
jgi:hypothetical protein